MNSIGERIVFLREERDMSQKHLAYTIGIAPTTLSRYENNLYEPKAEILNRLAKALDTTSDFLIGLTDIYEKPADARKRKSELTADEQRLLSYYRKLTDLNQARLKNAPRRCLICRRKNDFYFPQHFLYFFPLPHGHGSFRPIFLPSR